MRSKSPSPSTNSGMASPPASPLRRSVRATAQSSPNRSCSHIQSPTRSALQRPVCPLNDSSSPQGSLMLEAATVTSPDQSPGAPTTATALALPSSAGAAVAHNPWSMLPPELVSQVAPDLESFRNLLLAVSLPDSDSAALRRAVYKKTAISGGSPETQAHAAQALHADFGLDTIEPLLQLAARGLESRWQGVSYAVVGLVEIAGELMLGCHLLDLLDRSLQAADAAAVERQLDNLNSLHLMARLQPLRPTGCCATDMQQVGVLRTTLTTAFTELCEGLKRVALTPAAGQAQFQAVFWHLSMLSNPASELDFWQELGDRGAILPGPIHDALRTGLLNLMSETPNAVCDCLRHWIFLSRDALRRPQSSEPKRLASQLLLLTAIELLAEAPHVDHFVALRAVARDQGALLDSVPNLGSWVAFGLGRLGDAGNRPELARKELGRLLRSTTCDLTRAEIYRAYGSIGSSTELLDLLDGIRRAIHSPQPDRAQDRRLVEAGLAAAHAAAQLLGRLPTLLTASRRRRAEMMSLCSELLEVWQAEPALRAATMALCSHLPRAEQVVVLENGLARLGRRQAHFAGTRMVRQLEADLTVVFSALRQESGPARMAFEDLTGRIAQGDFGPSSLTDLAFRYLGDSGAVDPLCAIARRSADAGLRQRAVRELDGMGLRFGGMVGDVALRQRAQAALQGLR